MSCQRGNIKRSRAQKHKNNTAFKNNLHGTSLKLKLTDHIDFVNVCERCKNIIEWKIKYNKYMPLKAPKKCTKCEQKTVKYAYHIVCLPCSRQWKICSKCGVKDEPSKEKIKTKNTEVEAIMEMIMEEKNQVLLRQRDQEVKNEKSNDKDTSGLGANKADKDTMYSKNREELFEQLEALTTARTEDGR